MSLRKKTLAMISATLLGLIALLLIVSRAIFLDGFNNLEALLVSGNIDRAVNLIEEDAVGMLASAQDWAYWDDTYQFVQDRNEVYAEANLSGTAFENYRLNAVMFIDREGEVVFGWSQDETNQAGDALLIRLTTMLQEGHPLFAYALDGIDDNVGMEGALYLPEGPILLAATPILTTDGEGPTMGQLLWARYLGESEMARLAELTQFDVHLQPLTTEWESPRVVQPLSETVIAGYGVIDDVFGSPSMVLQITQPRFVHQQGQVVTALLFLFVIVTGVIFSVLMLAMLERTILSRLAWLSWRVSTIRQSGNLSIPLTMAGSDELSNLAQQIGGMLAALHESRGELQSSEARYAGIFRHSLDGIYLVSVDADGRFRYVTMNPADERALGMTASEIAGNTPEDLFSAETASMKNQYFRKVVETGEPVEHNMVLDMPTGTQTWQTTLVPIRDTDANIVQILGTARDISEMEVAQEKMRRQALVFENIHDAVLLVDSCGVIIDCNPATLRVFGRSRDELVGQSISSINQAESPDPLLHEMLKSVRQHERWQGEVTIQRPDGSTSLTENIIIPIVDSDGNQSGAIGVVRDVTERKRAEVEILYKTEALAQFSASLRELHRITLSNYDDLDAMFREYLRAGCEIFRMPTGVIGAVDDDIFTIQQVLSNDVRLQPGNQYTLDSVYCAESIRTQHTVSYRHVGSMPEMRDHPQYSTFKTESYIGLPVYVNGTIYGTLVFSSPHPREQDFSATEIEIAELMAQSIGRFITAHQSEQQRRSAESALRETNQLLQALISASPLAITVLEPDGTVVLWNPAAERTFGWTNEETVGRFLPFVRDEQYPEFRELLNRILQGDSFTGVEVWRERKDGRRINVSISSAPLYDSAGSMRGIISLIDDVTERREIEEQIRHQAYLLENVSDAVMSTDVNFNVTSWNHAAELIYGYTKAEIIGQSVYMLQTQSYSDNWNDETAAKALFNDGFWAGEIVQKRRDGSNLEVLASITLLKDVDGGPIGIVAVNRDITERKKVERQNLELALQHERLRIVADFVRDASHDFRTPLANIRTSVYLLQRATDDPTRERRIEVIEEQVSLIDKLVDSLLTITRLNSGVEFHYQRLNVNELLQQVQVKLHRAAERKQLRLMLILDEVAHVNADETYLFQALLHLAQNAIDYTDDSGEVTIHTAMRDSHVMIEVCDNGIGISADMLPYLFDRAYSNNRSQALVGRTGLGLPIAKKIIDAHNGQIEVESRRGEGSVFRVLLPAEKESRETENA